ncbi:hypothetical protein GF319_09640 [Candidatus Bathyarchaeota archaeon]|nr:hypothetical protein [Candidatus Bathyarchaeota archaeon]
MSKKRRYRGRLLLTALILVAILVLNLFSISRLLNVSVLWPIDESNMDGYLVSSSYVLATVAFLLTLSEIFITKGLTIKKVESQEKDSISNIAELNVENRHPPAQETELIEEKPEPKNELENENIEETDNIEVEVEEDNFDEEFEDYPEPIYEELDYGMEQELPLEESEIIEQDHQAETGLDFLDNAVLGQTGSETPELDAKDDDPYYNKYKISTVKQEQTEYPPLPESELVNTLNEFEVLVNDLRSRVKKKQE